MSTTAKSDIDVQLKALAGAGDFTASSDLSAADSGTPDYLVPKMRQYAIGETAQYQTVHIARFAQDRTASAIAEPLDPFSAESPLLGTEPAEGVLLTHRQGWQQIGLALGELLHSLCLAPGEATRIAVVDWRRQSQSSGEEDIAEDERLSREDEQNRAVSEVQKAVAAENQIGSSLTRVSSKARQRGRSGSFFGLLGGSSGSASSLSSSSSVSFSAGKRELASEANQKIHHRTREVAEAVRSRRASLVQEVSERESETVTTRVVANYNHMHALTVMYFELLQVFSLVTEAIKAERLIFLPLKLVEFDATSIKRHRETLIEIATDFELEDLRKLLLLRGDAAEKKGESTSQVLQEEIAALRSEIPDLEAAARAVRKESDLTAIEIQEISEEISRFKSKYGLHGGVYHASPFAESEQNDKRVERKRELERKIKKEIDKYTKIENQVAQYKTRLAELEGLLLVEQQDRLAAGLNREQLFFNQQIWMRLDDHRVYGMVAGRSYDNKPLAGRLDPKPVAVFGNYVAFRLRFADEEAPAQQAFEDSYLSGGQFESQSSTISLPSGGIFAEAVLGEANSAEEIDLNRFWNWSDSPIPILPPEIGPVATGTRAAAEQAVPGQLAAPAVQLQGAAGLPDPTGSGTLLQMLAAGQLFRDMSGLAGGQTAAGEAGSGTGQGASDAAAQANAANKAYLDFVQGLAETGGKLLTANNSTVLGGLLKLKKPAESE
ncbi:hypothetical protein [Algihabitans albus]|uniref:hypothetical protein n=1 Tax=Algihabitans albus TaxID=2164067 RepID=UPI000E5C82A5|nr:hypothetical protein [Algihabitans albus]